MGGRSRCRCKEVGPLQRHHRNLDAVPFELDRQILRHLTVLNHGHVETVEELGSNSFSVRKNGLQRGHKSHIAVAHFYVFVAPPDRSESAAGAVAKNLIQLHLGELLLYRVRGHQGRRGQQGRHFSK